jgi:eukaryotic-like serine/threonine-protein kinase
VEGTQIGQYRIERQLGQGGFGVVYVATDLRLGRRAAVKQLLPELSGNREIVERFFNEAKAAASIDHPGIVEIYDVGWHTDGSAYFAMKLLEGQSLAGRLRATGPLPIQLAATIARQISSALVAAHAAGIVHRDLKPDNVILVPDDEVAIGERAILLDFGIAKLVGSQGASQKTRTGMMMGTPSYMSPEQCRGAGEVDQRTDVYALGCILFEMLAGRPPFVAEGAGEVVGMHQFVDPPALRSLRADLPAELDAVVMRALAKRPEQRMQQMSEVTAALQPFAAAGARSMEHAAQRPSASGPVVQAVAPTGASVVVPAAITAEPARPVGSAHSTLGAAPGEITAPAKPRRGLAIAVGGVVLAGAGIAVAVVLASRGDDDASRHASHATTSDAAPEPRLQVEPLLAEARDHLVARRWQAALAAADRARAVDANHGEIRMIVARATRELEHQRAFDTIDPARVAEHYAEMVDAFTQIPEDSVYSSDARGTFEKAGAELVALHVREARAAAEARRCDEVTRRASELAKLERDHAGKANAFGEARTSVEQIVCAPAATKAVAAPGSLSVESTPSSKVFLDRKLIGTTPLANLQVPAGKHNITFVVGAQKFSYPLVIEPGKHVQLSKTLPVSSPSVSSSPATSGDIDAAKTAFLAGQQHYVEGRFEEAIQKFKESHLLSARPELLFNIGMAYRRIGNKASAIRYFKQYLAAAPAAKNAAAVRSMIEALE